MVKSSTETPSPILKIAKILYQTGSVSFASLRQYRQQLFCGIKKFYVDRNAFSLKENYQALSNIMPPAGSGSAVPQCQGIALAFIEDAQVIGLKKFLENPVSVFISVYDHEGVGLPSGRVEKFFDSDFHSGFIDITVNNRAGV